MKVNENKISFIICTNDDLFMEECMRYIKRLEVPEGMEAEVLEIRDAVSMTAGYNEGMKNSDAKYKIYMHQDVFLVYKYFLYDIINLFRKNPDVGMIGMVGSEKIPESGIMWSGKRVGAGEKKDRNSDWPEDGMWEVECIDGMLMATQEDVTWREDLFDGWDFYDIAQCCEMRKRGYRIVVPAVEDTYYIHDDKLVLALLDYNKYRKIFCREYLGENKDKEKEGEY